MPTIDDIHRRREQLAAIGPAPSKRDGHEPTDVKRDCAARIERAFALIAMSEELILAARTLKARWRRPLRERKL